MRLQGELTGLLHCSSSKEALLIHRWIPVSIIVKLACKMVHEKVGGHAPPVPMSAGGELGGGGPPNLKVEEVEPLTSLTEFM